MASNLDLLDSLLQNGMKKSTAGRLDHSLSEKGIGGPGGILDEILGGASGNTPASTPASDATPTTGGIGDLLGSILGGNKNVKTGVFGAIIGALLGGGSRSAKGALQGGALAVLGSIALKALRSAGLLRSPGGQPSGKLQLDPATKLAAGLRRPETVEEEQQLEAVGELIVKAMVNAAKADGRVDETELKRIVSNAEKDDVAADAREFLAAELRKPMDTDGLVRAVSNPQLAAQVYTASLMAIELDTPQEKQYLSDLASKLKLDAEVVRHLHGAVGLA